MSTYGYVRVSTEEQARSGLGIAAQRNAITHAAELRLESPAWVMDEGISGSTPPEERPGLGPLLAELGPGDVLMVAKLDRLGRTALDVLELARAAGVAGWTLVVLDLGIDTSTPMGRMLQTVMAAVAELERDLIRQRTSEALQAKKAQGVRLGRPVTLDQEVRERIAVERSEGRSLRAIAADLTEEGVPTASGSGRWHPATVKKVAESMELDREAEQARA